MSALTGLYRRPAFTFRTPKFYLPLKEVRLAVDMILLCALIWAGLVVYAHAYKTVAPVSLHTVTHATAITITPAIPAAKPHPNPTPHTYPAVSQPTQTKCAADSSYVPAGPIAFSASQPGLHTVIDAPHYYRVYGNTNAEIRQQIRRCAPTTSTGTDAAFSAQTDYWMGWQFNYTETGTRCVVTTAAVGLHFTQVYPQWQPTGAAQSGLDAQWLMFMHNLQTHENGHVGLGERSAQEILSTLQSMSAPTCPDLVRAVASATQHELAALKAANNGYDLRTGHGVTQGAILP